jgi:Tol biopolymer transport system component
MCTRVARKDRRASLFNLYRAPVLGGEPLLISRDVDTNITFSPSGDRIAFARANAPKAGMMSLLAAGSDGRNEQVLLTESIEAGYSSTPAWSPDGQLIAFTETYTKNGLGQLSVFDLASHHRRLLLAANDMLLTDPQWLPDQRGLLVLYTTRSTGLTRRQIGAVSYPAGVFRTITNDINNYVDLRLSSDGRSIATILSKTLATIEVMPGAGGGATASRPVIELRQEIDTFAWTADGGLLYPRANQLIVRDPDGRERSVFVSDDTPPTMPDVCRSDGSIVFVWPFRNGATTQNVWRINSDGTAPRQLSDIPRAFRPVCSPDGQWAAFQGGGKTYRVRMSGGAAEVLNAMTPLSNVAYSPEGERLAVIVGVIAGNTASLQRKLLIITPARSTRQMVDADTNFAGGDVRFTPDGAAVAYVAREGSVDNIRIQPLDGSMPGVITSFSGGRIARFRWSPDGSQLALLRQRTDSDVVLLRDTAPRGR